MEFGGGFAAFLSCSSEHQIPKIQNSFFEVPVEPTMRGRMVCDFVQMVDNLLTGQEYQLAKLKYQVGM